MIILSRFGSALFVAVALCSVVAAQDDAKSMNQDETTSVSQVRIVRLSQVKGKVQLDRGTDQGFEATFANLPIVQGEKLQTVDGMAEVEFEDNSSLRIAPHTQVEFSTLGRTSAGATENLVKLDYGTMYLSLASAKGNDFVVNVGGETVTLPPASHVRLDVYPDGSELVVFHGKVRVTDATNSVMVGKDKALKFGGSAGAAPVLARDDRPGLYDQWDQMSVDYHSMQVGGSGFAGTPYQYGVNDLSYYGSFNNVAGCGQVWQPYFASAGWSPYASGIWAYYPGAGYSWVSPYPWGWTPYHSGEWMSCPNGGGWGWRPGGTWSGLNNTALGSPVRKPVYPRPPHGPAPLITVGASELRVSRLNGDHSFEFTKDSAGLGVPREGFANLHKVSAQVASRGSVQVPVETTNLVEGRGAAGTSGTVSHSSLAADRPTSRPVAVGVSAGRSGSFGGGASAGSSFAGSSSSGSAHGSSSISSVSASSGASSAGASGGSHK